MSVFFGSSTPLHAYQIKREKETDREMERKSEIDSLRVRRSGTERDEEIYIPRDRKRDR